jgi:hypothetical protein
MADAAGLQYHALIGGTSERPIFCSDAPGHEPHPRVESAGACALTVGDSGTVYETRDGVFADTFWAVERVGPDRIVRTLRGSGYKGKKRDEI